jgi:hypothetical protein
VKIYLRVPYPDRREAKRLGAHWEPSTKRWYVVSSEAWLRCKRWALPLSNEERDFLSDPARKQAYAKAFKAWQEEHHT